MLRESDTPMRTQTHSFSRENDRTTVARKHTNFTALPEHTATK